MSPPRILLAAIPLALGFMGFVFLATATNNERIALIFGGALIAAITAAFAATWLPLLAACTCRRSLRHRRPLEFYELVLSTHDESRLGDVADMMEVLVGVTRTMRVTFARSGQPPIVFQTQCMVGRSGRPEVVVQVGCLPELASAVESAIHTAYPDVRLGIRDAGTDRQPTVPLSFTPTAISRWRKSRSFIHPVMPDKPDESTPPLRAVIATQVALGAPSAMRVTIVPARELTERFARSRFRRHENRIDRSSTRGLREAGLKSRLASQEMSTAAQALNSALAHCVIEMASTSAENADRLGSALRAHRGSNRLYSETWLRHGAARRRFIEGRTHVMLDITLRRLFSTQELAFLLALPGAEAKDLPLRRLRRPRLPAAPDVLTPSGHAGPDAPWAATHDIELPGGR